MGLSVEAERATGKMELLLTRWRRVDRRVWGGRREEFRFLPVNSRCPLDIQVENLRVPLAMQV